jgi:hypothetical protein
LQKVSGRGYAQRDGAVRTLHDGESTLEETTKGNDPHLKDDTRHRKIRERNPVRFSFFSLPLKNNFYPSLLILSFLRGITGRKESSRYFQKDDLELLFERPIPRDLLNYKPKCVLTLVDPSGLKTSDSATSEFAALTCFYRGGQQVVRVFFSNLNRMGGRKKK